LDIENALKEKEEGKRRKEKRNREGERGRKKYEVCVCVLWREEKQRRELDRRLGSTCCGSTPTDLSQTGSTQSETLNVIHLGCSAVHYVISTNVNAIINF
jgi:hypothetical protein